MILFWWVRYMSRADVEAGQPCLLLVSVCILIVQHLWRIKARNITQNTPYCTNRKHIHTNTHQRSTSPYFNKHLCISVVFAVYLGDVESRHTYQNQLHCSLLLWPHIVHCRFVHVIATLCYCKRTVHHQLPNVSALWSKATSLSVAIYSVSEAFLTQRCPPSKKIRWNVRVRVPRQTPCFTNLRLLPICCHVTNPWRSKDHTRNDIVQQPYAPRFPDETTGGVTPPSPLWNNLDIVLVFLLNRDRTTTHLLEQRCFFWMPPRCKEKGDLVKLQIHRWLNFLMAPGWMFAERKTIYKTRKIWGE